MRYIVLLFILLAGSLAAMAQSVRIGTGELTGKALPWDPTQAYSMAENIYLRNEINAAGNISAIQFYFNGTSLSNSNRIKLWLGHTPKQQFNSGTDWVPISAMTKVFDGTVASPGSAGWITINFSTPFNYNNTDNLVIAAEDSLANANTADDQFFCSSTESSGLYRSLFITSTANINQNALPPGFTQQAIANCILSVAAPGLCNDPLNILTNVTNNGTQLNASWSYPGGAVAAGYQYALSFDPVPPASGTFTATASMSAVTAPYNQYFLHVRTQCGSGFSNWSTQGITTITNDNCNTAAAVPVNNTNVCAASLDASSNGATRSGQGCQGAADDDVWFKFTATATTHKIKVTPATLNPINDIVMQVYSVCGGTQIACVDETSSTAEEKNITAIPGQDYIIKVYSYDTLTGRGAFNICITTVADPPANDECSGSVPQLSPQPFTSDLTGSINVNTTNSTASANPLPCTAISDNDDVWYRFTATDTGYLIKVGSIVPTAGSANRFGYALYSGTSCSSLVLVRCNNSVGSDGTGTDTTGKLIPGSQYFLRIFTTGNNNAAAFKLVLQQLPPAAVSCNTILFPSNGVTAIDAPAITLRWTNQPNAYAYSVYASTSSSQLKLIGTVYTDSIRVSGLGYDSTYYWMVVPKNQFAGPAQCTVSSFTTKATPVNCVPSYSVGCAEDDYIKNFTLLGGTGSFINNNSGCAASPVGYSDNFANGQFAYITPGTNYPGLITSGYTLNYVTMWADWNSNGFFEAGEKLLGPITVSNNATSFNLPIPLTVTAGQFRLRVRMIYVQDAPATMNACNAYGYGETEDYKLIVNTILPVQLVHFSGHKISSGNLLQWQTAGQKQLREFIVEKSADGNRFAEMMAVVAKNGTQAGAGFSYEITDLKPMETGNYYRLKMVHADGSFQYSKTVFIAGSGKQLFELFTLFPNPAEQQVFAQLYLAEYGPVQYIITDGRGRRVAQQRLLLSNGMQQVSIPVQALAAGQYVITFTNGLGLTKQAKFIKIKH